MSLFPLVMPAPLVPVTVTYVGDTHDAAAATAYTFSGASLGAAAGNRAVVVVSGGAGAAGSETINTITVGGESATKIVAGGDGNAAGYPMGIFYVVKPTGATGDIVVTFSGGMSECGIGVYAVYGADATATDTATDEEWGAGQSVALIDCPENGAIIGGVYHTGTGGAVTWVGITEDYDDTVDAQNHGGASDEFAAAQTNLNVGVTCGGSHQSMCAASWGP
tara:strand:+ start:386 stop:1048 length:663 start_codon:yes stop_codon:yes gene_type:complete